MSESQSGSGSGSNWAGNITYHAPRLHFPERVEQVQALVRRARKVRVLGARHSFSDVADSYEDLLSLDQLEPVLSIDRERNTVTVNAGIRYGHLGRALHRAGYALHNMASLPHITVAGACATATHGSGDGNGNLATAVAGIELVTADGSLVGLSRRQDEEHFAGAVVGLGGLGVVTKVTLDIVPAFEMRQAVYENLSLSRLEEHFDDVVSSAYSVSLFTDWQSEQVAQVWVKRRVADAEDATRPLEPELFGATLAPAERHPISGHSTEACTPQMGKPGPWCDRLTHFRMEFTPSAGAELQTEYFVPRQHAVSAMRVISGLREQLAPVLQISEIRTIAADDLWLSPCYGQPCVAFHFTWIRDWEAVRRLLPQLEEPLAPFQARPHWGKLFTMPAARVQSLYARLPDFQRLLRRYDPQGTFRNPYLDRYIFGGD